MNVQVWGATGMLGSRVVETAAAAGHTVIPGLGRIEAVEDQDIADGTEVIVNCAGLVKQRKAFSWPAFMLTNGVGPHNLAFLAEQRGIRLIHISTDCVFQGAGPHYEGQSTDANDMYAATKRAGEVMYGPHLTIRTSFVGFGPRGLLHDLQHKESIRASTKLLWNGHTVDTIAILIAMLLSRPYITGLLHVPGENQNRYTLAQALKARWELPARIEQDDGFVADRRLYTTRWFHLGLPILPDFATQLERMKMRP